MVEAVDFHKLIGQVAVGFSAPNSKSRLWWSQVLCRGEHRGVLKRLPEKFDLLDRGKLDLLRNHWTVGKERQYDQVKEMVIRPAITEIGCDRESRYCTALVEVLPNLVAVWTVWGDEKPQAPPNKWLKPKATRLFSSFAGHSVLLTIRHWSMRIDLFTAVECVAARGVSRRALRLDGSAHNSK